MKLHRCCLPSKFFGKTGTNPCESFRCELEVKDPAAMREENGAHLYGSGIFVMNPPWHLEEDMREVSNYLKKADRLLISSGPEFFQSGPFLLTKTLVLFANFPAFFAKKSKSAA